MGNHALRRVVAELALGADLAVADDFSEAQIHRLIAALDAANDRQHLPEVHCPPELAAEVKGPKPLPVPGPGVLRAGASYRAELE